MQPMSLPLHTHNSPLLPATLCWLLLLTLAAVTPLTATGHNMMFVGTIGKRPVQLQYFEGHGYNPSREGWLTFLDDSIICHLSIQTGHMNSLYMEARLHNFPWRNSPVIRMGVLEGSMDMGIGKFSGTWYGAKNDTADCQMIAATVDYTVTIEHERNLMIEWVLPIFLPAFSYQSPKLNQAIQQWIQEESSRQKDSLQLMRATQLRDYEERWGKVLGGSPPDPFRSMRISSRVCWCSKELVSVLMQKSSQGILSSFEGWNYRITKDSVQRIYFSDLFTDTAAVRQRIIEWGKQNDSLFAAQIRNAVDRDEYKHITNTFVISPNGIWLYFVYRINGQWPLPALHQVEIPYQELKGLIREDRVLHEVVLNMRRQ